MKIKLHKIVDSSEAVNKLLGLELPAKVSFKVAKTAKKISETYTMYEETRTALIKKLGTEGEVEGDFKIDPKDKETIQKFTNELNELRLSEEEIDIEPLDENALDGVSIDPRTLIQLEWLFQESN